MSLRGIHALFVLIVLIATEMFGAWGVWTYQSTGDAVVLIAGIFSFLAGFAIVGYAIWFVHKLDKVKVQ